MQPDRLAADALATPRPILFHGVLADEPGQLMLALLGALAEGDRPAARDRYAELFCRLAEEVELEIQQGIDGARRGCESNVSVR